MAGFDYWSWAACAANIYFIYIVVGWLGYFLFLSGAQPVHNSLTRIESEDTDSMLLSECHTIPEHTLTVITADNPSLLLPFTRHPLLFAKIFAYSTWLWDFNSNNLFRPLYFRAYMEMQLIDCGKAITAEMQKRKATRGLEDECRELGPEGLKQETDTRFVIVTPEVEDEEVGDRFVLVTPRVEREEVDEQLVLGAPRIEQDELTNQIVLVTPNVEQDEPTIHTTLQIEESLAHLLESPVVELGFILLRIRSTTCHREAASSTLDITSTYEPFYYSTLEPSTSRPPLPQRFVCSYAVDPANPALPTDLAIHNEAGTHLGPRVTYPSSSTSAKLHWNTLNCADRAYYFRHMQFHKTCREDYLAQKQEWARMRAHYPWTPGMQHVLPTWELCEPVFGLLSVRFCVLLGVARQARQFHRVREAKEVMEMEEAWIARHIMPEIRVMLNWDVQHRAWKSDVEAAKGATRTQDEELSEIWGAAKAKRDAREAAGWPAVRTPELQAIVDRDDAEVERAEMETRRWWRPAGRIISITEQDVDAPGGVSTVEYGTPRFMILDPEAVSNHSLERHFVPGGDFSPVFRGLWHFELPASIALTREFMVRNGILARPMRTTPEEMQLVHQMVNNPYREVMDMIKSMSFAQILEYFQVTPMEDVSGCICELPTCEQCNPTAPNHQPQIRLEQWEIEDRERAYMLRANAIMNGQKRKVTSILENIVTEVKKRYRFKADEQEAPPRIPLRRKLLSAPFVNSKAIDAYCEIITRIALKAWHNKVLKEFDMPDAPGAPLLIDQRVLPPYGTTPPDESASLHSQRRGLHAIASRVPPGPEDLPTNHTGKRKSDDISTDPPRRHAPPSHNRAVKKTCRRSAQVAVQTAGRVPKRARRRRLQA